MNFGYVVAVLLVIIVIDASVIGVTRRWHHPVIGATTLVVAAIGIQMFFVGSTPIADQRWYDGEPTTSTDWVIATIGAVVALAAIIAIVVMNEKGEWFSERRADHTH